METVLAVITLFLLVAAGGVVGGGIVAWVIMKKVTKQLDHWLIELMANKDDELG